MAAAIQLRRSGLDPLLIERDRMGGLLWNAHWVENYPGFPSGITGPQLVRLFQEQTRNTGVRCSAETVERVCKVDGEFKVETRGDPIRSRAVVVTSGTSPRPLPDNLRRMCGSSPVFYEVKDLPLEKRGHIAILGGGDASFDYALGLAREGSRVDVCFRSERPQALSSLVERIRQEPLVQIRAAVAIEEIRDDLGVTEIGLSDGTRLKVDALLVAIGRDRNSGFLDAAMSADLETDGPHPIPGLTFAGDVRRGLHRQTAIAVGDGVSAAMHTAAFLTCAPGLSARP